MSTNYIEMIENIKKWLKENLSDEKYIHSIGVSETAGRLATRFNEDVQKAELAGLLHDMAKCIKKDELMRIIQENSIDITEPEKHNIKTLHAPVAAFLAQKIFGVKDQEIIRAIRNHTLGRVGMSKLEKIVYLADKIEPYTREEDYRSKIVNKLEETNSLEEAILITYESTIKHLIDKRFFIVPRTIEVWNSLIAEIKNS